MNKVSQLVHIAFKQIHQVYLIFLAAGVLIIIGGICSIYDHLFGEQSNAVDIFVSYFVIPYTIGLLIALYEYEVDGEKTNFALTAFHSLSSFVFFFFISQMRLNTGSKDYILILFVGYFILMASITVMYYECRGSYVFVSEPSPPPPPSSTLRCNECNKVI